METSVVDVTVREVVPETPPDAAVIVVEPAAAAEASPLAAIVATPVFDDVQVTEVVRFCVAPFENVPVAANC
jgi:succinyl-CoA synthetase alpha subunit